LRQGLSKIHAAAMKKLADSFAFMKKQEEETKKNAAKKKAEDAADDEAEKAIVEEAKKIKDDLDAEMIKEAEEANKKKLDEAIRTDETAADEADNATAAPAETGEDADATEDDVATGEDDTAEPLTEAEKARTEDTTAFKQSIKEMDPATFELGQVGTACPKGGAILDKADCWAAIKALMPESDIFDRLVVVSEEDADLSAPAHCFMSEDEAGLSVAHMNGDSGPETTLDSATPVCLVFDKGLEGLQGPEGEVGAQGKVGFTGPLGLRGEPGEKGVQGHGSRAPTTGVPVGAVAAFVALNFLCAVMVYFVGTKEFGAQEDVLGGLLPGMEKIRKVEWPIADDDDAGWDEQSYGDDSNYDESNVQY